MPKARVVKASPQKAKRITIKKVAGKKVHGEKPATKSRRVSTGGDKSPSKSTRKITRTKLNMRPCLNAYRDVVGASAISTEGKYAMRDAINYMVKAIWDQIEGQQGKKNNVITVRHAKAAIISYAIANGCREFVPELISSVDRAVENYVASYEDDVTDNGNNNDADDE